MTSLRLQGFIVADKGTVHRKRRKPVQTAVKGSSLERLRQHVKSGEGANLKMAFPPAGGNSPHQAFAMKRVAVVSVCPTVGENFVDPQFQQRRRAVPLHRMLPDDQIGTGERLLFGGDIDIKIRIELIEGTYLYVFERPCLLKHPLIRMRMVRIRMGVDNEYHD